MNQLLFNNNLYIMIIIFVIIYQFFQNVLYFSLNLITQLNVSTKIYNPGMNLLNITLSCKYSNKAPPPVET